MRGGHLFLCVLLRARSILLCKQTARTQWSVHSGAPQLASQRHVPRLIGELKAMSGSGKAEAADAPSLSSPLSGSGMRSWLCEHFARVSVTGDKNGEGSKTPPVHKQVSGKGSTRNHPYTSKHTCSLRAQHICARRASSHTSVDNLYPKPLCSSKTNKPPPVTE